MHHASQQDWTSRSWRALALFGALALSAGAAWSGDSYYGSDSRHPSFTGGFEGSHRSPHFHGSKGFHSFPGNFDEGTGPRNDHGHSGDARKYGAHADASGHHQSGYLVQRLFKSGGYSRPDRRLFHYRSAWYGER